MWRAHFTFFFSVVFAAEGDDCPETLCLCGFVAVEGFLPPRGFRRRDRCAAFNLLRARSIRPMERAKQSARDDVSGRGSLAPFVDAGTGGGSVS